MIPDELTIDARIVITVVTLLLVGGLILMMVFGIAAGKRKRQSVSEWDLGGSIEPEHAPPPPPPPEGEAAP